MAKFDSNNSEGFFKKESLTMPEGYYSVDTPNPNIENFLRKNAWPLISGGSNDEVMAFDRAINTHRGTNIYNMHAYWSKKSHNAITEYIEHYTNIGDIVLDPFCGSGSTALSALMVGRKAIAIDRSPAATFITNGYCSLTDIDQLQQEFNKINESLKILEKELYSTICHKCGSGARIHYQVYSMKFQCLKCLNHVPLARTITKGGKNYCPFCHNEIKTSQEKLGYQLLETWIYCQNKKCGKKSFPRTFDDKNKKYREVFENVDIKRIEELDKSTIPAWVPAQKFPPKTRSHTLITRGVNNMRDLYTKRNLIANYKLIELIKNCKNINIQRKLFFIFTSICLKTSKMMGYNEDRIGRIRKDSLQAQFTFKDVHVMDFFRESYKDLLSGFNIINNSISTNPQILISTQNAYDLSNILSDSVDYIFTDPPYGDKIQFWEMNLIWENWLGFNTNWENEEVIVCKAREKTETEWYKRILKSLQEMFRVLKPGHWLTLTYHDISAGTWHLVQDAASEAGFIPDSGTNVLYIESNQKSEKQYKDDLNINKRDLVINFRKPKSGESHSEIVINENEDETTFYEKVRIIIREVLTRSPGYSKDRIYDEVISKMVRRGQMEPHNFDELLLQVAEEVKHSGEGKWYLKETETDVIDKAEGKKEDYAAESISKYIQEFLKKNKHLDGVHYSDIFEHYVYSIKDKPRRQLVDWLLDYFYKTDSGTYRLPASPEEEKLKTDARTKGINRRIKRYVSMIENGIPVPVQLMPSNSTLMEWIRQCRRTGMYEQGKLLYERGGLNLDQLSEEAQVEADEDYQVCVKKLNG